MIKARQKELKTTDYHNFSYRGTSKEQRKKLNIGDIYVNAAICRLCGWFIRSRNKHDMVTCSCGAVSVDGGSFYQKLSGNPENYQRIFEPYGDVDA